ncbi:MAG: OmpH family outer membrane protein [Saprospiraceae bacterium]|jgi:outer membrane protein|nr:OmpH family outer membrane protein [Saprospiraceae bacterium]NUQ24948.1 OmpH family outer membrane protein [Saprospiraceae bacterium]
MNYRPFLLKGLAAMLLVMSLAFSANAQRIACVDVNKILESIQEYKDAQDELDRQANKWRQDIAQEYDVIKGMYNRYQAEQVLLSDEARRQREEEITNKEKEVRDMQKAKFGPEGELFKRRQELVRPIQDKVYSAIEDYAAERGFDFIFDKGGSAGIIFSSAQYDKTSEVLERLKKK